MIWLAFLFGAAQGAGEIDIQNQPTGVMWCGQNFVLNFTYPSNVAAGTEFKVQLMYDAFDVRIVGSQIGNNKEIVNFGTVKAPETLFSVLLPSPFPAAWLGDKKLDNEGLQQKVLFRVSKVTDDKFNSDCSENLCRDSVFGMNCCPADNAAKCGCDSCSCANNDVCGTNLECDYTKPRGVCQLPLPGLGENCPNNKCAQPYICQCPMGTSCLAQDKTCNDNTCAKPAMGTPGRLNCPCSPDQLCESGTSCQLYFCRVSNAIPIGSLNCEPSLGVKAKDVCMLHKDGSAPRPYSCQNRKCTICEPGNRLCVCKSLACLNPEDICEGGRCFPRTGCQGCPCTPPESSCNAPGTICISNTCRLVATNPPTTTPATTVSTTTKAPSGAASLALGAAIVIVASMMTMI